MSWAIALVIIGSVLILSRVILVYEFLLVIERDEKKRSSNVLANVDDR